MVIMGGWNVQMAAGPIRAALVGMLFWTHAAAADDVRVATFHTGLSARGPGLMLRDILKAGPEVQVVARMIAEIAPDILVLQDVDYDAGFAGLGALADAIDAAGGPDYPHRFALRPNSGTDSGLDLDGDGLLRGPRDGLGYGRFSGDGGMAILSLFPIDAENVRDLSATLWDDVPGAVPPDPPFPTAEAQGVRRLSSVAHWIVPVDVEGTEMTLLTWSATPPVFDGKEDLNGRRNRDETAIWTALMDGKLGDAPPPPLVVTGLANLDPLDGEGRRDALDALLSDPRLQDPQPRSEGAARAADADHRGDPALDTADFDGPGNLRLSYLLPSSDIRVQRSGVFWPPPGPEADRIGDAELWPRHRVVWADLVLP